MNLTENPIKYKVILERIKQYVAWVNFVLILYLFTVESPLPYWLVIPIAGIGILIIGLVDYKIIFPRELGLTASKNPYWQMVLDELKEINRILKAHSRPKVGQAKRR
jgi:preprotein translocase subunit Sss1